MFKVFQWKLTPLVYLSVGVCHRIREAHEENSCDEQTNERCWNLSNKFDNSWWFFHGMFACAAQAERVFGHWVHREQWNTGIRSSSLWALFSCIERLYLLLYVSEQCRHWWTIFLRILLNFEENWIKPNKKRKNCKWRLEPKLLNWNEFIRSSNIWHTLIWLANFGASFNSKISANSEFIFCLGESAY